MKSHAVFLNQLNEASRIHKLANEVSDAMWINARYLGWSFGIIIACASQERSIDLIIHEKHEQMNIMETVLEWIPRRNETRMMGM